MWSIHLKYKTRHKHSMVTGTILATLCADTGSAIDQLMDHSFYSGQPANKPLLDCLENTSAINQSIQVPSHDSKVMQRKQYFKLEMRSK